MDIDLARTFLEVVSSGSFVAAAERLHLTQTAISARIRTLEEQVGRRLFIRNRSGARLTPAGERFRRDALILVQVWERARQRVALSASHVNVVSIGGELSLWNPVLVDWLGWMHRNHPEIALRAEVEAQDDLLDKVRSGAIDVAVLYSPPPQPDLATELVHEEKLVMVTTREDCSFDPATYVHVDWGADFRASEQVAFPHLSDPAVAVSLGPLALSYLLNVGGSGYFRLSAVRQYLADRRLRPVESAPEFSYSVHMVYSARNDADIVDLVRTGLRASTE
ncbi:MAG TPA: LysR family transcriptional regulator [Dongiaceae bacterium]|nr:LysR family transcriptional regulator [Dongiaceae bacterium]